MVQYAYNVRYRLCSSSDNAHIADAVSLSLVSEHVINAFRAGTVLILAVAWVHAVNVLAVTWVDHDVVWVREVSERSINRVVWDSGLHQVVVKVVGDGVSGAWLWLVDLWVECSAVLSLFSHSLFVLFLLLLLLVDLIVNVAVVHVAVGEEIPTAFPVTAESSNCGSEGSLAEGFPVVAIACPVVSISEGAFSPVGSILKGTSNVVESSGCPRCNILVSVFGPVGDIVSGSDSPAADVVEDVHGLSSSLSLSLDSDCAGIGNEGCGESDSLGSVHC